MQSSPASEDGRRDGNTFVKVDTIGEKVKSVHMLGEKGIILVLIKDGRILLLRESRLTLIVQKKKKKELRLSLIHI